MKNAQSGWAKTRKKEESPFVFVTPEK